MDFFIHLTVLIGIYALLGISLNLLVGYTGSVSLAQGAFFGVGAYATAVLSSCFAISFWLTCVIGAVVSILISLLAGKFLASLQGDLYTLGSLALGTIITTIFLNWTSLTKGPIGIAQIPRPELLGTVLSESRTFAMLVLVTVLVMTLVCMFFTRSAFGVVIRSIREDEKAIQVFGYRTERFKQTIYALSAAIAALAGSLFASYVTFVEPSMFFQAESIFLLTLVILGGLASHTGSISGAIVLVLLPELLRFLGLSSEYAAQVRQILYGVGLVLLLYLRPRGLFGTYVLRS